MTTGTWLFGSSVKVSFRRDFFAFGEEDVEEELEEVDTVRVFSFLITCLSSDRFILRSLMRIHSSPSDPWIEVSINLFLFNFLLDEDEVAEEDASEAVEGPDEVG